MHVAIEKNKFKAKAPLQYSFNKKITTSKSNNIDNTTTFVPTNIVRTNMKLEDVIKSEFPLPLPKKTVLNILYTHNAITEKFIEVLRPFDISGEQFNVLRILRGQKGSPVNMCTIQERMVAKTSNTTRLVDKLLVKGLVTREVCPANRRKMEVQITEKGLELLERLDPKVDAHEQQFVCGFDETELQQLNDLLEKFRSNKI